ncbi:MAG: FkbM family methyltransferase [Verrucomicrobiota bacterium]
MLIDLERLCSTYGIHRFGVLHIGAHEAQEREAYQNCGAQRILWIEANPDLAARLKQQISMDQGLFAQENVLNTAVFDSDGERIQFHVATDTQASSLLELGTHRDSYPSVTNDKTIEISTKRIETLCKENEELFQGLDFANLDIQGAELNALKGFGEVLNQFQWIYTEVNRIEVYKKNGMIWEIDRLLLEHHFFRKNTVFTNAGWGDAFYVRQPDRGALSTLGYRFLLQLDYLRWSIIDSASVGWSLRVSRRIKREIKNRLP